MLTLLSFGILAPFYVVGMLGDALVTLVTLAAMIL